MVFDETTEHALHHISTKAFTDERICVESLLSDATCYVPLATAIEEQAKRYIEAIRAHETPPGVERFIAQFGLESQEGIALMCLAEALLRIPDRKTADALIEDKLKDTNWTSHLGKGNSIFVNASTYALMLTGAVTRFAADRDRSLESALKRAVGRLGEPVIRSALRAAMTVLGKQFVLGPTLKEALDTARVIAEKGYLFSYDVLGEGARTAEQAHEYFTNYREAIETIGKQAPEEENLFLRPGVSVKLSAIHPRYQWTQRDRIEKELLPKLKELALLAKHYRITLSIDAEEANRFDLMLHVFTALMLDEELADYNGLGFVLQAYQKRAREALDYLTHLANKTGRRIPIRLVKGAYWDSEIKHAQVMGLKNYPVFTQKSHTDLSYLACASVILKHRKQFYPQFATHNAMTVAAILKLAEAEGWQRSEFEFQRLYGMGQQFYDPLADKGAPEHCNVRIYAPIGPYASLLPYLIRRLLENGANTSFVHLIAQPNTPLELLLKNPLDRARASLAAEEEALPLPAEIYGNIRKNSRGFDLGYRANSILAQVDEHLDKQWKAMPMFGGREHSGRMIQIASPNHMQSTIGTAQFASKLTVTQAVEATYAAFPSWNAVSVEERATCLDRIAEDLEANRAELIALLMREAGRNWNDSIAEVREAADFCRYYASLARRELANDVILKGPTGEDNRLSFTGRGVFACISPWNFPLAIFTGQIVAALVTGNTVVAKPAEQTPLIAARAVRIMIEAGIPRDAIALLPGTGEEVGAALTSDPRIAGVVFTGGTETARAIHQSLAAREAPIPVLIAETGGINAMIVDSSALLEQAVDDIVNSAFGSAGQRCSALRLLYIQEECTDALLHMLQGAMQELRLGDPSSPSTDIGPIIDGDAQHNLSVYIEQMKRTTKLVGLTPMPKGLEGHFVAPHAFLLPYGKTLKEEIFGPVLHIQRFRIESLDATIDTINASGYGLTFGIHSRITERINHIASRIRAGNIYINRSMIGATVGVQPFGGMGFSGTGPKAGGPEYLKRFVTERTVSHNTAAIGGNLTLLNQQKWLTEAQDDLPPLPTPGQGSLL